MEDNPKAIVCRYIALDIHKHYCVIAGVDRDGQVMLQPVRVEHENLEGRLKKNLLASDQVVIESTTNAWHVYDLLEPLVAKVLVANPIKVKQIACARVKTDKKDTLILPKDIGAMWRGCWQPTWCQRCGCRRSMCGNCGSWSRKEGDWWECIRRW